ncbi:MAG: C39 family peptidase [Candidatus Andersenbacteria bacterium]|nr:C39 family peptidase [Candidatus Andersenbacteria bacterium]MBI3250902.1 C39 family peptidase [Candidatus Andersenbacteria bacterium]
MKKTIYSVITIIIVIGIAGLAWRYRDEAVRSYERASLPSPVAYIPEPTTQPTDAQPAVTPRPVPTETARPETLKASVNLAVPFTVQAPNAQWEAPYKEFCEEASALMAAFYVQGKPIPNATVADTEMLKIKTFEEKQFGYYEDTTAAETAKVLTDHFKLTAVKVVPDPTVAGMKEALAAGKVVLVPAAGRLLGNPYFQQPGPLYHMLVIKGYTDDGRFIVNDPGTRRGADFLYSEETIMNAMHDWRSDQQIELGRKVVILVG